MGMYDYVYYKTTCPGCDEMLDDFQSKDGDCLLDILQPQDVEFFYTSCDKCNEWVEFQVISKEPLELKLVEK
jgi:hypothetical protein